MKKFRISVVVLLLLAVVVALVTCSIHSKSPGGEEEPMGFFDADAVARVPETVVVEDEKLDIDIPLWRTSFSRLPARSILRRRYFLHATCRNSRTATCELIRSASAD